MRLRAVLASLPEGSELLRGRRGWLACERGARATLLAAGFGPDGGESLPHSDLSGRGPLWAIEAGGERWIVRRFHHGGLLRVLGERMFLAPARPFRELALARELRELGLPTPRVVAARCVRAAPLGWRLALVSARIEDVTSAAEVLARLRRGALAPGERRQFLATLGELVGRMHAARFLHADLTPCNLLVSRDLASGWVLDLDRGRIVSALSARVRRDNLRRLYRFVRRREARAQPALTRGDYARFLDAYCRALERDRDWRADWRAIVHRDRLRAPAHRIGWWFEELFGSGPERRDGRRPQVREG
jgi:3-deoxy-D-manno-octulosonic acid kinase